MAWAERNLLPAVRSCVRRTARGIRGTVPGTSTWSSTPTRVASAVGSAGAGSPRKRTLRTLWRTHGAGHCAARIRACGTPSGNTSTSGWPTTGGLRRSTRKSYGEHIDCYLKPHLGDIELDQLRVAHLNEMFAAIDADNERILWAAGERQRLLATARQAWRSGDKGAHRAARADLAGLPPHRRTVGAATMQRIRATLRSALEDAVRQGLTAVNVAKLTKLQTGKRPKALVWTSERVTAWQTAYERELAAERASGHTVNAFKVWVSLPRPSGVMVWTPEQIGIFLDHAAAHPLYPLFHLMAFRGLRRGEACGLAWPDLDLAAASLTVRENRVKITYQEIEDGNPKTDAGEDTIPLDSGTVTVLEAHHRRQDESRAEWGQAWQESGRSSPGRTARHCIPIT